MSKRKNETRKQIKKTSKKMLTLTGVSVLSVEFKLLLGNTFLCSCGLMSILASGGQFLGQLSLASLYSGGISSQYLHQGEGQQLQVKITSSGSRTDPLPHIAMRNLQRWLNTVNNQTVKDDELWT